jgi:glycosyltransferase involved in cell wall biosynthesis
MPKVKVLHVTSTPEGIGGVEKLLLDLAPHYDFSQVEVWHCNLFDRASGQGRFPTALKHTGLPYLQIRGSRWHHLPGIIWSLSQAIRKQRVDVLHLHMAHGTIIGGLVGLFSRVARVVVTKHYVYRALPNLVLRSLDRLFTNRADAVVAVSGYVRDDLVANGAERSRVRVIHNGMDLDAFDRLQAHPPEQLGAGPGELLIGCVGNLQPIKGHEYLLRAMPIIAQGFPSARLIIVGEGAEKQRLMDLAKALRVDGAVTMAGFRADVPVIMRQIDVCVQPSLQEAFGIVLLEAMAAARPVVASNVEGIPEIVIDGVTGLLVPAGEPAAIARAVCALLADRERRMEMGRSARSQVERHFDIRATVRCYEDVYGELAGRALHEAGASPGS